VWLPKVTIDTLAESPFAMRRSGVVWGPSSPGQVGMPARITSETSCTFIYTSTALLWRGAYGHPASDTLGRW
jgi:hypothetical protein